MSEVFVYVNGKKDNKIKVKEKLILHKKQDIVNQVKNAIITLLLIILNRTFNQNFSLFQTSL
jgi:hypothetical protein